MENNTSRNKRKTKPLYSVRSRSRILVMKVIYQSLFSDATLPEIAVFLEEDPDFLRADKAYFQKLVNGLHKHWNVLMESLFGSMGIKKDAVSAVEMAVIILAAYELLFCADVPYQVVINEAVEITKVYGSSEGFRYVNGVLDCFRLRHKVTATDLLSLPSDTAVDASFLNNLPSVNNTPDDLSRPPSAVIL